MVPHTGKTSVQQAFPLTSQQDYFQLEGEAVCLFDLSETTS